MAAQNTIELGFNIEEFSAEKKQVLDLLTDLFQQLEKYDGTKFNPLGNGGVAELKKSLQDGAAATQEFQQKVENYNKVVTEQFQKQQQAKKATDELTLAVKEYEKIVNQTAQTQAKQNAAGSNAAENLAIEKEQLRQRNKELQEGVKFLLTETGSVGEAKAAVAQLTAQRDKLNLTTEEGKAKQAELNAEINRYNEFIKANVSSLEQQKINIGNYTGAAVILKDSLTNIGERLTAMATAGDVTSEAFQKLILEQKILQALLDRQAQGFANVNQEMKATKNALDTLTVAGLEQSETFEKINQVYTTTKQKLNELHTEQKILTAESPGIAALSATARGLGGAYALGAGGAALLADGNEKVEKELNKLVAIMTVLQGLEEAVRAIKERGAIATVLQAQATRLLNAAKEVEGRLFGKTVAATVAETEAKVINTEAQEANAAAQESSAAGAELNTVAMEETTVATEEATVATYGLETALIATGIGAIIIGLIFGITKLVGAISDWITSDERAEEAQKAIIETTEQLIETTKELDEAYRYFGKERIENLQKQADLAKAAGVNEFIALNNEKAIIEERLSQAKKLIDQKKIDQKTVDNLHQQEIDGLEIIAGYQEALAQAQADYGRDDSGENKARIQRLKEVIDGEKARTKVVTEEYNIQFGALKEKDDAEKDLEDNRIKTSKAASDELAKITADIAKRQYEIAKDANDRILNLDRSTADQRSAALSSNYQAEAALNNSQVEAVRKQLAAKYITEADAGNQLANLRTDLNTKYKKYLDDQEKLRIEYRDRELTAQNSISKSRNDSDAAIQEAITKDQQKELQDRLDALKKNIDDKTKVIVDDYNLQVRLAREHGKTEAEIQALAEERDKNLAALTATTQKEIYDITVSYGERRLKAIEDTNKAINRSNAVTTKFNDDTDKLNQSFINGKIGYEKYLKEKRQLDDKYTIEKDKADIKDDEDRLNNLREYLQKELNLKLFFAEKELDRAKAGGDEKEIADAQSKADALQNIKKKAAADDIALTDDLNKKKGKLSEDEVKKKEQAEQFLIQKLEQIGEQSLQLAQTLVDASFENRINNIQKEIDKTNEQAQAEIEAINRSTLSQQDKAAELIILQANQRAHEKQLQNEQKAEKVKQAKFDREMAVAQVVWKTAEAEMAAIAAYAGTPLAWAIEAAIGTLGAIEIATILAKPIPTYGEGVGIPGKGRHAGGPAWTGERFEPELVSIPGEKPFIVDKPTLLDLPADSSVIPLNAQDIVHDIGWTGMMNGAMMINSSAEKNDRVVDAINNQTQQMKRAYAQSQRKIQNIVNVHIDAAWSEYVNKKIIGKA